MLMTILVMMVTSSFCCSTTLATVFVWVSVTFVQFTTKSCALKSWWSKRWIWWWCSERNTQSVRLAKTDVEPWVQLGLLCPVETKKNCHHKQNIKETWEQRRLSRAFPALKAASTRRPPSSPCLSPASGWLGWFSKWCQYWEELCESNLEYMCNVFSQSMKNLVTLIIDHVMTPL